MNKDTITSLREEVKTYLALWAEQHARINSLPEGHIHSQHYDRLIELGARMHGFKRWHPPVVTIPHEGGIS